MYFRYIVTINKVSHRGMVCANDYADAVVKLLADYCDIDEIKLSFTGFDSPCLEDEEAQEILGMD